MPQNYIAKDQPLEFSLAPNYKTPHTLRLARALLAKANLTLPTTHLSSGKMHSLLTDLSSYWIFNFLETKLRGRHSRSP